MKKMRKQLYKILISFIVLLIAMFVPFDDFLNLSSSNIDNLELCLFLVAYLAVGAEVVKDAVHNILKGQVFDENFLMTVATVGAFLVSKYPEAVAVMLFYQVGELFQSYAVNKSRKSISELMDIRPDYAFVKRADGTIEKVDPYDVKIGEIIVVKPGEKIAIDGKIVNGNASLDISALTGESVLRDVEEGDEVISGSINKNGLIEVEVIKEFSESTVVKILELVENASDKKAQTENFITRFARYYTPIVCILALLLAVIPPIITDYQEWSKWIYRALAFLVISCPCALVISVPLSFFGGIGGASAHGVLIKGSNYLEALAKCNTVVFDKTGTLTKGVFWVNQLNVYKNIKEEDLIRYAAYGEAFSNHPIAISIKDYYYETTKSNLKELEAKLSEASVNEVAGQGTIVTVNNEKILVGNEKLFRNQNIEFQEYDGNGTVVYIAVGKQFYGSMVISDQVKEDSKEAIIKLKKLGIKKTVMLTGDRKQIAESIASSLGIDEVFSQLLPGDKVDKLEELLNKKNEEANLAYVGDGINDAPVLARADIGIAMGGLGSDAAIEAADIVLMDDNPLGIVKAIKIARKTTRIVRQNIVFAIGVKVFILLLAALGIATMWAAVFADVGVAVIAILNALRALKLQQ